MMTIDINDKRGRSEKAKTAFDLGAKGFDERMSDAPLQDPELLEMVCSSPPGQQSDLMDAWRRGFHTRRRTVEMTKIC